MTRDEVKARVEAIRATASDAEKAHADEDVLWCKVLTAIAQSRVRDGTDRARRRYAAALAWLRRVESEAWITKVDE